VTVIAEAEEVPPAEDAMQPKEESKGFFASVREYFRPANAPVEETVIVQESDESQETEESAAFVEVSDQPSATESQSQDQESPQSFFDSVRQYFTIAPDSVPAESDNQQLITDNVSPSQKPPQNGNEGNQIKEIPPETKHYDSVTTPDEEFVFKPQPKKSWKSLQVSRLCKMTKTSKCRKRTMM